MLTNGVETSRAEDSVLRVCASRGYRHINVFTTPTCIIIADDKFDGLSFMRTIKRRSIDLNKIDLLNTVSRDFVQNPEMTTDEAINKLKKINIKNKKIAAFDEDFATVNPYLGTDGIKPFVDVCKEEKKGIFVLVKTSNPSSGEFQDRLIDGRPLYELVGEKVAEWGADAMGDEYSYVGCVVGATYPKMGEILRKVMPKSYILVPGYGAQGGTAASLRPYFNEDGLGAIVNSSRGIIAAYKQEAYSKFGPEHFAEASRAAAEAMIADIASIF